MFLSLYKTNKPYLILLIPLTGILLWLNGFINCNNQFVNDIGFQMPLYKFISPYINYNCYISKIIALVIAITQSFYLSKLNKDFIFIKQRTFLHALIFLMILSSSYFTQYAIPALIANFFVLFSIDWLYSSYKKDRVNIELFNAGFMMAVAGLFYLEALVLFVALLISYIILHTTKLKEVLVMITGFITPIFILLGILFLNDTLFLYKDELVKHITEAKYNFDMNMSSYIFYGYLLFIFLISVFKIMSIYSTKKISSRSFMSSFFVFFFVSLLSYIIFPFIGIEMLVIAAVPISYIITDGYVNSRNSFISELNFALLIITLLFAQLGFNFEQLF